MPGPLKRPAETVAGIADGDGRLDLFLTNGWGAPPFDRGPYYLLRNVGAVSHWLALDLEGTRSNRLGLGARVTVVDVGPLLPRDDAEFACRLAGQLAGAGGHPADGALLVHRRRRRLPREGAYRGVHCAQHAE